MGQTYTCGPTVHCGSKDLQWHWIWVIRPKWEKRVIQAEVIKHWKQGRIMIICANFVFILVLKTVVLQCHSGLVCAAICLCFYLPTTHPLFDPFTHPYPTLLELSFFTPGPRLAYYNKLIYIYSICTYLEMYIRLNYLGTQDLYVCLICCRGAINANWNQAQQTL